MIIRMDAHGRFRRRILCVDSDAEFVRRWGTALRGSGYEVLTANDGFAALQILRGGQPDLLVTELNLQRMSGFELLSVVRSRFPNIGVIAVSSEYTAVTVPDEVICDTFLSKGPNLDFELVAEAERLISESPVRGSRAKSTLAPVWIPMSASGYIILTCPECLRSFSAPQPKTNIGKESCLFCSSDVPFQMSSVPASPEPPRESALLRSRQLRTISEKLRNKERFK
jgi:CheY-like chemotaxis protein